MAYHNRQDRSDEIAKDRFRKTKFAAWVGIIGNLILAILKAVVGYVANSKALLADAAHSASDVVGSAAVLIGLRAAQLPPDKDHPYGHGKAESISAIIVAILLFVVGIEIGLSSFRSIFQPLEAPGVLAVYTAIFSIVVKEIMFRYKYHLGKKYNSQAVVANAFEHRSDVFSSAAALIGISGAVVGGKFNIPFFIFMDPIAGIFVSLLVLKMGYNILKESIHNTLDHVLHDEDARALVKTVQEVKGVLRVDELRAREHGHYVIVDVKISVDPEITVQEGHSIAKRAKQRLVYHFSHVQDVLIHVNPYEPTYPYKTPNDDKHDSRGKLLH